MLTNDQKNFSTNDKSIRVALRKILEKKLETYRANGSNAEIFEELGVQHGTARIDFAIVNGIMHGYEIKSDRDTLERLPDQIKEFSSVFDELTLVVGKRYLYEAVHIIPDWWGIMVAKTDTDGDVVLQTIREPEKNKKPVGISIARLLWREEALHMLEERNKAEGLRYKPREFIYEKLAHEVDTDTLKKQVSEVLVSREGWRADLQLVTNGG